MKLLKFQILWNVGFLIWNLVWLTWNVVWFTQEGGAVLLAFATMHLLLVPFCIWSLREALRRYVSEH